MWGPILGGFTILGVFLTLSAWINGRSIKRLIQSELTITRELIEKLITKLSEQHERMSEQHQTMIKFLAKTEN